MPAKSNFRENFLEFAREVIVELAFRFEKHRMIFVFHQRCEPDAFRIVVLPQDRGQAPLARHQFQLPTGDFIVL